MRLLRPRSASAGRRLLSSREAPGDGAEGRQESLRPLAGVEARCRAKQTLFGILFKYVCACAFQKTVEEEAPLKMG